jgi:hypothetical protein
MWGSEEMAVATSPACQSSHCQIGSFPIPKSPDRPISKSSNPQILNSLISKALLVAVGLAGAALAAQPNLKIVVIAGEDAVNIIQQRTAVAPIVEVRDRNDLPVAGALVTFSIGGGNASFSGGLQSLTVTTDAAGRAAASTLTPTGSGMLQIDIVAAHQGETAAATVTQTNYATTADAARAGRAAAGAAGGTFAASGGAGGGLSPLAIGLLAGGAGGGAIIAARTLSRNGGDDAPSTYTGTASGTMTVNYSFINLGGGPLNCTGRRSITATMSLSLSQQSNGAVSGQGGLTGTQIETAATGGPGCTASNLPVPLIFSGAVTGTTSNVALTAQNLRSGNTNNAGRVMTETVTERLTFAGSLGGGVVAGTIALSETSTCTLAGASCGSSSGATTLVVTLR